MQELQSGANHSLGTATHLKINIIWSPEKISACDVDTSAFLLLNGHVRSDSDFIFYNQPTSNDRSIQLSGKEGNQNFSVDLSKISSEIDRIAFTITIHGQADFSSCSTLDISIEGLLRFSPQTTAMKEKALILGELYLRNNQWKFKAIGQGFNGGLDALATHFGVSIDEPEPEPEPETPTPVPPLEVTQNTPPSEPLSASIQNSHSINLQKRLIDLEKNDPKLVNLVKKVGLSLEKKGLSSHLAKVALCLDISGSMNSLFRSGAIDQLVQRILALGLNFDDNGEIDVFLFGKNAHEYGTLNASNYTTFVQNMLQRYPLEVGTSYGKAIQMIRSFYNAQNDKLPTYVMFVTDGNTSDQSLTESEIKNASHEPMFWQFMAIGKRPDKNAGFFKKIFQSDFSFLESLDTLPERFIDNANFFLVENPNELSDEELYELLMQEYPSWLALAREKGLTVKEQE